MNATKRKFNALIQGIGSRSSTPSANSGPNDGAAIDTTESPSRSSLGHNPRPPNMTFEDDILAKRRRLQAFTEKHAASTSTIKSVGGVTNISNVVLKKWTPAKATQPAKEADSTTTKYSPTDRDELLKRLATFQEITEWSPKPDKISEIEWAKRGWVCQGKERVRCTLCSKELVVKLSKTEADGKDVPVLVASDVEEAMKEKYSEMIVTEHQEDCLWRRQGCEDSLLRLSVTNAKTSLEALRQRYDELCERKAFLPYEFNLRLPTSLNIDALLAQLPPNFFTEPPAPDSTGTEHPNRVALALAITGWQGLSNTRIGAVPNSASCHTCLRRLGLWMFKSKEVGDNNEILVPAPMDHLDPVREHRFFCPWKNAETQRWSSNKTPTDKDASAWYLLAQAIKNDAYLRGALESKPTTRARSRTDVQDNRTSSPAGPRTPTHNRNVASVDVPSITLELVEGEDEASRDAKDKERWARLRRVKSLFETKGGKKLRRTISRPGTGHSHASSIKGAPS